MTVLLPSFIVDATKKGKLRMDETLWSAVEIDGRSGKIQVYNGLRFKVENGKPFIKVPDRGLIKTPAGWLMLPQNSLPRSVFLERVLSFIAFFPYEKANLTCQHQAIRAYLERMRERVNRLHRQLEQELSQTNELIKTFEEKLQNEP